MRHNISKRKPLRMLEVCASEIAREFILPEKQWQRAFVSDNRSSDG